MPMDFNSEDPCKVTALTCPHCGAILPPGSSKCPSCGASIQKQPTCPNCGGVLQVESLLCPGCHMEVPDLSQTECPVCHVALQTYRVSCPYCRALFKGGQPYVPPAPPPEPVIPTPAPPPVEPLYIDPHEKLPRTGFRFFKVLCYIFAIMYAIAGVTEPIFIMLTFVMLSWGFMFSALSQTYKNSLYVYLFPSLRDGRGFRIGKIFFSLLLGLIFPCMVISSCSDSLLESKTSSPQPVSSTLYLNAPIFANLSSAELVALLGEPSYQESGTFQGLAELPCVYYEYNTVGALQKVRFLLIQDQVVQLTSATPLKLPQEKNILKVWGIPNDETAVLISDTDTERRFRCPSATVDDIWLQELDASANTCGAVCITYDLFYMEEWGELLSPASEEYTQLYQQTQELIYRSLAPTPRSEIELMADLSQAYPKNPAYVSVSGHIRTTYPNNKPVTLQMDFIYAADTHIPVFVAVEGKEVYNDNYVPFPQLLQENPSAYCTPK